MQTPLQHYRYLLLSTCKRNGQWVDTPVWFAHCGESLVIFSAAEAGKVKRLRHTQPVRFAPCTVSGKPLGDVYRGQGRILQDQEQIIRAKQALNQKYGWQMKLLDLISWLGGRINQRAFILITPDA